MKDTPLSPAQIDISDNGTVRSLTYGDIYFAPNKGVTETGFVAVAESGFVFLMGCAINDKLPHISDTHTILELGFGTGLNFLLTLHAFAQSNKAEYLHFISIEKHPIAPDQLRHIYGFLPAYLQPYANKVLQSYPPLVQGVHTLHICGATLTLYFDDIIQAMPQIPSPIESVYLDGFAPSKNPAMWHADICTRIYKLCTATAYVSTFTAASSVQKALKSAGFFVQKRKGFARKRDSIIARKTLWHPPVLSPNASVAIVGAGIMGSALAHHLAEIGYNITLYDLYARPLMGTSGNPYALLMPKFNKTVPFHQNAYAYAHAYFNGLGCMMGDGIIATPTAIANTTPYAPVTTPHPQGIQFNSGVIPTATYADMIVAHPQIQFLQIQCTQPFLNTIPNGFDMTVLCLGADTNTLLPAPLPYTINRGSIAIVHTPPPQMPTTPVYHKGYAFSDGTIGICGTHFERIGTWQADIPPLNARTHRKYIADKMRYFDLDLYNTPHTLQTGIRANTKNRTPVIHQLSPHTFCIYGMGSRGYINAPYTAHLFCEYLLKYNPHPDLEPMVPSPQNT